MYRLESLLPGDKFNRIISEFSINKAQLWLDSVREMIGGPCYDEIKKEFRAIQDKQVVQQSEMNCFTVRKACDSRNTIFQVCVGAAKHPDLEGKGVDDLFVDVFSGV